MTRLLNGARIFFSYSWYAYRALFTWLTPGTYLVLKIFGPVTQVLFFTLMGQASGQDPAFFIIGNSTQTAVVSGIFGVMSVISNERRMGTLPQLIIVPTNDALTFYGRGLFLILDGMTSIVVSFAAGALIFGLDFSQVDWLGMTIALAITCFSVSGMGLCLGVMGLVGTDLNLLLNIALSLLLVLCGANFPIEELPRTLQVIAQLLPMTHGIMGVRAAFGGNFAVTQNAIAWEGLIGMGYMLLGYLMFGYFERLARRKGTLDLL